MCPHSLGYINTHKHTSVWGSVFLLSAFMSSYLMEIDLTAHPEVRPLALVTPKAQMIETTPEVLLHK